MKLPISNKIPSPVFFPAFFRLLTLSLCAAYFFAPAAAVHQTRAARFTAGEQINSSDSESCEGSIINGFLGAANEVCM